MRVIITGAAGFIGFHVMQRLLQSGRHAVGLDNFNTYYDPALKERRAGRLQQIGGTVHRLDITDAEGMRRLFTDERPQAVIHLAAQAGVRYCIENPEAYVQSNDVGFCRMLELCRQHDVERLVYASSSSVYGADTPTPAREDAAAVHPVSFYAASKRANELYAEAYAAMYGLHGTGLRYFTVYGPLGRPDMALFRFARALQHGEPVQLYNGGRLSRDMTYIDDIVEGTLAALQRSGPPHRIYNLGSGRAVTPVQLLEAAEAALGRRAERQLLPMQIGDVPDTLADITRAGVELGYVPRTMLEEGVARALHTPEGGPA